MPIYVRDLKPPSSPTLSQLSSTVSANTQKILQNLDTNDASNKKSEWLNRWLERKVVEESWDDCVRNEKNRNIAKSLPKPDEILKPQTEVVKNIVSQLEVNDLGHYSNEYNLLVYVCQNVLVVNCEKLECEDLVEEIVFVEETKVKIVKSDKIREPIVEGQESVVMKVNDVSACLLVILYKNNLGEVKISLNFNKKFINFQKQCIDDHAETPFTLNPRTVIAENNVECNNVSISSSNTLWNRSTQCIAIDCTMENENPKNSPENHVKVFKIPIEVWAAQIKEAFENEENKGNLNPEIRIENQEFTPPVIVWERKEKTDCRYENMSEAIAARYRKLHFYLNKTHDRVVKAMKFDNHKNLNMFWMNAEQNELAISWTFSSANKIHIYKIADPVVKGKSNAGPSKPASESTQKIISTINLVDDIKMLVCRNKVLACLCGLGRQNIFIYLEGQLWSSIKTDCEVVDMKLMDNESSIVVSHTNNKCSKFMIFDTNKSLNEKPIENMSFVGIGHMLAKDEQDSESELIEKPSYSKTWQGMSNLDRTLQIMKTPVELPVKPVFPQNRIKNKASQKLFFLNENCVIQESGEASLPLMLSWDEGGVNPAKCFQLDKEEFSELGIKKVLEVRESFDDGKFESRSVYLLFNDGQLVVYDIKQKKEGEEHEKTCIK